MTGRELVRRAIKFQGPERVPYNLPAPFGSDFFSVGIGPDPGWKASVPGEDEWGSVWQKLPGDKTMGQVKTHPLDDYAKMDTFRFPNYDLPVRYEAAKKAVPNNKDKRFVLAGIPLSLVFFAASCGAPGPLGGADRHGLEEIRRREPLPQLLQH